MEGQTEANTEFRKLGSRQIDSEKRFSVMATKIQHPGMKYSFSNLGKDGKRWEKPLNSHLT